LVLPQFPEELDGIGIEIHFLHSKGLGPRFMAMRSDPEELRFRNIQGLLGSEEVNALSS
jgi:hypothetical protein